MQKFLTLAVVVTAFASTSVMTGCNSDVDPRFEKNLMLDFESATVEYLAGPTIACENFYSDFDGIQYKGYTDETTNLKLSINATVGEGYRSWFGAAVSNLTDKTTAGLTNQCSVYGTGGQGGSKNFAVVACDSFDPSVNTLAFAEPTVETSFSHLWVTNTTYAALSMLNGDSYARKFAYPTEATENTEATPGDWFLLTITAKDSAGLATGEKVEFYLADFRTAESKGVVTGWEKVDLSPLGDKVHSIHFSLWSSDTSTSGENTYMNTPAYFCFDDVVFANPFKLE
jgi:hypothetical protein